jgi:hypothetical protein
MSLSGTTQTYLPPTLDGLTIIDADQIYIDGTLVDINNLVPYTGATQTIDLNSQNIKTTHAPVAGPDLVNLTTLQNAIAFVDTTSALTFLNKVTTGAQTVAGPITFNGGNTFTQQNRFNDIMMVTADSTLGWESSVSGTGVSGPYDLTMNNVQSSNTIVFKDTGKIECKGYIDTDATASKCAIFNSSKELVSNGVDAIKLDYLDNVSSDIQTQLNGKVSKGGDTMTGTLTMGSNLIISSYVPTANDHVTNKLYVDNAVAGGSSSLLATRNVWTEQNYFQKRVGNAPSWALPANLPNFQRNAGFSALWVNIANLPLGATDFLQPGVVFTVTKVTGQTAFNQTWTVDLIDSPTSIRTTSAGGTTFPAQGFGGVITIGTQGTARFGYTEIAGNINMEENCGIGTTNPTTKFQLWNGVANIHGGGIQWGTTYVTQPGSLIIGDVQYDYGGQSGLTTNIAGLLLECLDQTEIAVHDSGLRVSSLLYYQNNLITLGRDMGAGWGIANVAIAGTLTVASITGSVTLGGSLTIGTSGSYVAGSIFSDGNWGMIFRAKQATPVNAHFMWADSANSELMRIDSAGNVGIGTLTPASKLHVIGAIRASTTVFASNFGRQNDYRNGMKPSNQVGNTFGVHFGTFSNDGLGSFADLICPNTWDNNSGGSVNMIAINKGGAGIRQYRGTFASALNFGTYHDCVMTDFNSPIVSLPSDLQFNNATTIRAKNASGTYETFCHPRWSDDATYISYGTAGMHIRTNAGATQAFFGIGGNLGLGTVNPIHKLQVTGTTSTTSLLVGSILNPYSAVQYLYSATADYTNSFVIETPWSSVYLKGLTTTGRDWVILNGGSGAGIGMGNFGIFDATRNSYVCAFDSFGRFGVGPIANFVRPKMLIVDEGSGAWNPSAHHTGQGLTICQSGTPSANVSALTLSYTSTDYAWINSLAPGVAWKDLVIASATTYVAYFGTVILATNAGGWVFISDAREKEDIQELKTSSSLKRILAVKPRHYRKKYVDKVEIDKETGEKRCNRVPDEVKQKRCVGFIAQELQESNPHCVCDWEKKDEENEEDTHRFAVSYNDYVVHLCGAVQELHKQMLCSNTQIQEIVKQSTSHAELVQEQQKQIDTLQQTVDTLVERDKVIVDHAKQLEQENKKLRAELEDYKMKTEERFNKLASLIL